MEREFLISNIPEVSAIYFALLKCGYDYYTLEKDAALVEAIKAFSETPADFGLTFFSNVRQDTCDAYPYWPRAAALEAATFYVDPVSVCFCDFGAYQSEIMSANNISEIERNQAFWQWVRDFPAALVDVMNSSNFKEYLSWENGWVERQNLIRRDELSSIQQVVDACLRNYISPIQKVSIILNPIKCAYAADYHIVKDEFFYCSGAFSSGSVVHEFLHHVVHPFIVKYYKAVTQLCAGYIHIPESYLMSGDENGEVNAFEEHVVRHLTNTIIKGNIPSDLDLYIRESLGSLSTRYP